MPNSYWLFGSRLKILADGAVTGGRYDLIQGWNTPNSPTPPHIHHAYSEHFYILDGEYTVWTPGTEVILRAGDSLLVPPGQAHALAATGDVPGRTLIVTAPSGFARLVATAGTADTGQEASPGPPDMELFRRICAELGDEILGPPGMLPR